MNPTSNLIETLRHLRHYEEFVLFDRLLPFTDTDDRQIKEWLNVEYNEEALGYAFRAPAFDGEAAAWAAKTVYNAGQLLLHRKHRLEDLSLLLPDFIGDQHPGSVLSADLTLRFLPDIINKLELIDPDDHLIKILENHLNNWNYSGIAYAHTLGGLSFEVVVSDPCLLQLYLDRIILYKNLPLASHPRITKHLRAVLGVYAEDHWKEYYQTLQHGYERN